MIELRLLGGYTPILADALTTARGYPVTVVNGGANGASSLTGAADISQMLLQYPTANYFLVLYGHNDASAGRPSGLGLTPPGPGYAGSDKDYMQRIIDAVKGAGKTVYLSEPSAIVPIGGVNDNFAHEYGMVIAELASSNGITVVPPDFYTYFSTRTATEYSNEVEMNGLGYQSMARLWLNAILGH